MSNIGYKKSPLYIYIYIYIYNSPPHEQNAAQGQFLAQFNRFEFRVFHLDRLPYLG